MIKDIVTKSSRVNIIWFNYKYLRVWIQKIEFVCKKDVLQQQVIQFSCTFLCTDESELKECLAVLVEDQQKLSGLMAKSTLSAQRLRQRLVILERYLISLTHSMLEEKYKIRYKSPPSPPLPTADNKR